MNIKQFLFSHENCHLCDDPNKFIIVADGNFTIKNINRFVFPKNCKVIIVCNNCKFEFKIHFFNSQIVSVFIGDEFIKTNDFYNFNYKRHITRLLFK